MSLKLANKVALPLDAGANVAVDSSGEVYETPQPMRQTLGPLAAIAWKEATFAVAVHPTSSTAAGAGTVKLFAGDSNELGSVAVDLTSGITSGAVTVDLAAVQGQTELKAVLNMDTAADTDTRASVSAVVNVTQPLVDGC